MMLAVLAVVSLSLASTNDYRYVNPGTTNLLGIGMGKSGDYSIVRAEDVAFIKEAYAERLAKLGAAFDRFGPTNSMVVTEERMLRHFATNNLAYYIFAPTFEWWANGRYNNDSYLVKRQVTFPSDDYWETETNFFVNGKSTDFTNRVSAFMNFGDIALPRTEISTNIALFGALTKAKVAASYTNIQVKAGVFGSEHYLGETWPSTRLVTILHSTRASFDFAPPAVEYKYIDDRGQEQTGIYLSTYVLTTDPRTTFITNTTEYSAERLSNILRMEYMATKVQPIACRRNNAGAAHRFSVVRIGEPYDDGINYSDYLYRGGPMKLGYFVLRTNEVESATCFAVIRFKRVFEETHNGYTSRTNSTSEAYFVATARGTVHRVDGTQDRWETDIDVVEAIRDACGGEAWASQINFPSLDDLPTEMDYNETRLSATCNRTVRIRNLEVFAYVHFEPVFNARVLDN